MGLAVFAVTYFFLAGARLPKLSPGRAGGALLGAAAMIALGVVRPDELSFAVDFDTLVLLLGMMLLSAFLTRAGFFRICAHRTLILARTPKQLLFLLALVSAALSAFLVNDTVCLMLTPLVLAVADSAELPPEPYLLTLCMAANAGSAATFTGNPQNMLIGNVSGLPYGVFARDMALPALLSTLSVVVVLLIVFKKELSFRTIAPRGLPPPIDRYLLGVCSLALIGIIAAFFLGLSMAWSALIGAVAVMVLSGRDPREELERIDYVLLLFFACLFLVVYGVNREGWADRLHALFAPAMTGGPAQEVFGFTVLSVAGSNLFSNVPWVMIARGWVPSMQNPVLGWQVLALSSTLAGNLTLIGSVANLIVFEGARGKVQMGFWRYLRVGAPVTLLSLLLGVAALFCEHHFFR